MSGASGDSNSTAPLLASESLPKIAPIAVSDNTSPSLQITPFKLNGRNFLQWSRSTAIAIRGKGKIGFLDGSSPDPPADDLEYTAWDTTNSLVMAWLLHSMEDNIGETFLFYTYA